jgi:hypothetical protein
MLELWELSLIAKGEKERQQVAPKVTAIAARSSHASEEELYGLRSYLALEHAKILACETQAQVESCLSNELNIAILATRSFVRSVYDIPMLWRVSHSYVSDLLMLASTKGVYVSNIIASEVIASVRESVLEVAPLAAQLLRDIIVGDVPAPLGLRAKYASEALARVGFGPITKSVSGSVSSSFSAEEIEALKARAIAAQEAAREAAIDIARNDIREIS